MSVENNEVDEVQQEETQNEESKGGKSYTQDDINRMMAAKAKEVTEKLNKQHEEELKQAKSFAADERQKLMDEGAKRAQMTAEQKAQADLEDRQKEIDRQKAEFQKTMDEFKEKQALSDTKDALIDAGLPKEFANFLSSVDEDTRNQNVSNFADLYNKSVNEAVDKRVAGKKTPDSGVSTTSKTEYKIPSNKRELMSMPLREQQQFMDDYPDRANALLSQR